MSEKPESEELVDEEPDEIAGDDDVGEDTEVIKVLQALDVSKKRGQKADDPAWRKLERMREERATREMIKDFEDYDIGPDASGSRPRPPRHA
jgi:hypothetical protein